MLSKKRKFTDAPYLIFYTSKYPFHIGSSVVPSRLPYVPMGALLRDPPNVQLFLARLFECSTLDPADFWRSGHTEAAGEPAPSRIPPTVRVKSSPQTPASDLTSLVRGHLLTSLTDSRLMLDLPEYRTTCGVTVGILTGSL